MHRRELLENLGIGALAVGATFAGIDLLPPSKSYPSRSLIYQAGTVKLSTDEGWGHGALMAGKNGYYVYTIGHVAAHLREHPNSATVTFPGLQSFHMDLRQLVDITHRRDEFDFSAMYLLDSSLTQFVQSAMARRSLTALVPSSHLPSFFESVAIPNTNAGSFTELQTNIYLEGNNITFLNQIDGNTLCEGSSGTPVLRVSQGTITNEVHGLVTAGINSTPSYLPNLRQVVDCSPKVAYRPYP